jgi:hypothetical protein
MPPALAVHLAEEKLNETMHTDNQKVMDTIEKGTIALSNQAGAPPAESSGPRAPDSCPAQDRGARRQ